MQDFSSLIIEPSMIALLSWWFGTGIILLLVRLPKKTFSISLGFWSLICIPAFYLNYRSMLENSNFNAYLGFTTTIIIWGWHELAFLTGWISGTRRVPLESNLNIWNRFKQSVQVIWHHELALLLNIVILITLQIGNPNHTAICTFTLLWLMRLSSKMNLFFGVPQIGEQYLPEHLAYMGSYFRKKEVGLFFYFSMSCSIVTWLILIWQAHSNDINITIQWVLLASLLGLAIVEHVLMMLPLSLEKVWGWALRNESQNKEPQQIFNDPMMTPIANASLVNRSAIESK